MQICFCALGAATAAFSTALLMSGRREPDGF